jgi:hypothetical protein
MRLHPHTAPVPKDPLGTRETIGDKLPALHNAEGFVVYGRTSGTGKENRRDRGLPKEGSYVALLNGR